jgi:hypothetical protein
LAHAPELGLVTTDDPGLHLMDDARPVQPRPSTIKCGPPTRDASHFVLPPGARIGRLRSRGFVPAQMLPDSADHRRLGVAIAAVRLNGQKIGLADQRLTDGWHAAEPGLRWTDGDAGLALAGVRELVVELAMAGRYWVRQSYSHQSGSVAAIRA